MESIDRSNKSCAKSCASREPPKRTRQSPTPARSLTDHSCRGRGGHLRFTVSCRRFYRPSVPTSDRETAALPNAADLGRRPPGTGCRARVPVLPESCPGDRDRVSAGPDTPTGNPPTPSMIYRGNIRNFSKLVLDPVISRGRAGHKGQLPAILGPFTRFVLTKGLVARWGRTCLTRFDLFRLFEPCRRLVERFATGRAHVRSYA